MLREAQPFNPLLRAARGAVDQHHRAAPTTSWGTTLRPVLLLLADTASFALAAVASLFAHPVPWHQMAFAATLLMVPCLYWSLRVGLYHQTVVRTALHDIPDVLATTLWGGGLLVALLSMGNTFWLGSVGTVVLASMPLRIVARLLTEVTVRHGKWSIRSRLLIIGSGEVAQRLAATLIKFKGIGIRVVGFVDDAAHAEGTERILGLPVYGAAQLEQVLADHEVDRVAFTFSLAPDSETLRLLRTCQRWPKLQVSQVPRFFEALPARTRLVDVRGIPLLQFETSGYRVELTCKRLLDIVVSGVVLILCLPLLLVAALAIRLDSAGPILFRQTRLGRCGRPFSILKLCSMRAPLPGEDVNSFSRHTPVGRWLRKSSIDELPQLWNVLRGDMSLVGPRPEREQYMDLFTARIPRYQERHRMRGGITGLSQISHLRGNTSFVERTRLDNFYIDQWSLWLDIKILLRTFTALVPSSQGIGGGTMLLDIVSEVANDQQEASCEAELQETQVAIS